ncbi:hypothetical protein ACEWY4_013484 [Coilia grayii]|uniref:Caveolin n=1 Tax=Coilia grayii TaxID=363190 RepID=A0ABD1JWI5_9TELE
MMRGVGHEEVEIDLEDLDDPQQDYQQQQQQLHQQDYQPQPPQLQQQQSWKTPLETVLEEEEEEEVEFVDVDVEVEDEDVISTQSDTRPLINERDPRQMNECLKVSFEDVIAEPESVHSGDRIWIWSHALFEVGRVWFYRIVTVLLAVPVSLLTGMLFGLLSCLHIWFLTPCVKITLLNTGWLQTLWSSVLNIFVLPLQQSAGNCYGQISVRLAQE